jgi:hypothetical protein
LPNCKTSIKYHGSLFKITKLKSKRTNNGFTLSFAVILCSIFAGLLYAAFYFFKMNLKQADYALQREKAIYLAESGNNRVMSRFNVKTLPDVEGLGFEEYEEVDDDEEFEDDFFDDFDDEFDDDFYEEDFDEDELEDLFAEEDEVFLSKIPRFINFYLLDPYYINIETGSIVSKAGYLALINAQQQRIRTNKQQAIESGIEDYEFDEVLIQEIYFPLPEVNVAKIGSIPIKRGIQLKPGFKIVLAKLQEIQLKQDSIVDEYFNLSKQVIYKEPKARLKSINPNFANPGDYLDINFEGENFDDGSIPTFSGGEIAIVEYSSGIASIGINQEAKPGKVQMKLGANKANFFIVPIETSASTAIISEILLPEPIDGERQFIKILDTEKISNIKITGDHLSVDGEAPIIVPDSDSIEIEILSFQPTEIVLNIATKKCSEGLHFFSIFTKGGQSNSWAFNVEKTPEVEQNSNPDIGSYTTVATLLEVNSLPNLPLRAILDAGSSGRPEDAATGSGRPQEAGNDDGAKARSFDLLKSDLELVWKLETIATVGQRNAKETRVVRRNAPKADAAFITNTELSFSQSSIIFEGVLEALTVLEEPIAIADTVAYVEGEDPELKDIADEDLVGRPSKAPEASAVVENFYIKNRDQSPQSKGFRDGGIITVLSASGSESYSDYAIVEKLDGNSITVKEPGFRKSHFTGDEIIQFIPAVNSPEALRDRDAQRNLNPPGAYAFIPNRLNFESVFRTKLFKLASWAGGATDDYKVPSDIRSGIEGYFGTTIISGTPSYTGANSLYGQGLLIIDTTKNGNNPNGGTVTLGGSSKLPSMFEGVIYIIGELNINGPVEIKGSVIVNSPKDNSITRVNGSGNISYEKEMVHKAIIHMPFLDDLRTRIIEPAKSQLTLLEEKK